MKACAILNELYVTVGQNRLYAVQGRASTNDLAARARELFGQDADAVARVQRDARGRQVEPHDGPDAHRLHLLEPAAAQRDARRPGGPGPGGRRRWASRSKARRRAGPAARGAPALPALDVYEQAAALPRGLQPRAGAVRVHASRRASPGCGWTSRAKAPSGRDQRVWVSARLGATSPPAPRPASLTVSGPKAAQGHGQGPDPQPGGAAAGAARRLRGERTATCRSRPSTSRAPWRPAGRELAAHPRPRPHAVRHDAAAGHGAATPPRGRRAMRLEYGMHLFTQGHGRRRRLPRAHAEVPAGPGLALRASRSTTRRRRS